MILITLSKKKTSLLSKDTMARLWCVVKKKGSQNVWDTQFTVVSEEAWRQEIQNRHIILTKSQIKMYGKQIHKT